MITALVFLLSLLIFLGPILGWMWWSSYEHKGYLDGKYPDVANHDIYLGLKRAVYLRGVARGERAKQMENAKRYVTKTRREQR